MTFLQKGGDVFSPPFAYCYVLSIRPLFALFSLGGDKPEASHTGFHD